MRIITFFLSIQFILTITGCFKSEQPDNFAPKLVWKAPLLNGVESFTFNPVFYKDMVIYGVKYARSGSSEKPSVVALKKATGEKVWEWKNALKDYDFFSTAAEYYIYQNIFVFSTGPRVYAIDLETGKSLWNTQAPESGDINIVGLGSKIYYVQLNFDKTKSTLCTADIALGNWKPVFIAQKQNMVSSIGGRMEIHKDSDGENYLYFTHSHTDLQYIASEVHLDKLNVRTDSMVLNKTLANSNVYRISAIDNKGVYLTGGEATCFDKNTGEVVKKYDLPGLQNHNYGSGRCIINGNKMFAPTDFPKLICYNIDSGNILWSEDGLSTSLPSRLIYHDGIIYYTSSSDGFLHAIDENGKRYWKFQSPDRKGSGNGIFDAVISIDAAENRLYVSSYYNAICYETIKK